MPSLVSNCELCGCNRATVIHKNLHPDRFGPAEARFGLVRCDGCDLVYLSPRPAPDELGQFYPDPHHPARAVHHGEAGRTHHGEAGRTHHGGHPHAGGHPHGHAQHAHTQHAHTHHADTAHGSHARGRQLMRPVPPNQRTRSKLQLVHRYHGDYPGRILDVGADGDFLERLAHLGWDVEGTDFSAEAAEHTSSRLGGRPIYVGPFEEVEAGRRDYHLVTFWDVLDHLYHPFQALKKARRLLDHSGGVLVSVPNYGSLEAKLLGRRWPHLEVPRRMYHFTQDTLRKMLEAAGFEDVKFTTAARILPQNLGRVAFPARWALDRWNSGPGPQLQRVADNMIDVAIAPARVATDQLGLGATLIAFARV